MKIKVTGGKCITENGTLAGSDLDMIGAVRNAVAILDIDIAQAVRMASILPARFINMHDQIGEIRVGHQANFVLVSQKLEMLESWIKGKAAL